MSPMKQYTPKPEGVEIFDIGDSVLAHSLQNAPELNGKAGRITAFVKERVSIQFDDGDRVNIKPENLKSIVADTDHTSGEEGPCRTLVL